MNRNMIEECLLMLHCDQNEDQFVPPEGKLLGLLIHSGGAPWVIEGIRSLTLFEKMVRVETKQETYFFQSESVLAVKAKEDSQNGTTGFRSAGFGR